MADDRCPRETSRRKLSDLPCRRTTAPVPRVPDGPSEFHTVGVAGRSVGVAGRSFCRLASCWPLGQVAHFKALKHRRTCVADKRCSDPQRHRTCVADKRGSDPPTPSRKRSAPRPARRCFNPRAPAARDPLALRVLTRDRSSAPRLRHPRSALVLIPEPGGASPEDAHLS